MGIDERERYIELGNFLKSRRNKIVPSQVGLPTGTRRRTPGLRREEVAQLAGIGLTWYTWLEQGRPITVSEQVLTSLAKVLLLDSQEQIHLFTLAMKPLPHIEYGDITQIKDSTQRVLDSLTLSPAYVMDQRWNIVGWNKSASLVFGDFTLLDPADRNVVMMMFGNHDYMKLFDDWEYHAKGVIARFRADCSKHIDDPWFADLVHRLKDKHPSFEQWWSMHHVHSMSDIIKELTHETLGKLVFEFNSFDLSDQPNLKMLIHTPTIESGTAKKLMS